MGGLRAASRGGRLKALALGSTALSLMLLAGGGVALAQPEAGSLPGGFRTNQAGTTYTSSGGTPTVAISGSSSAVLEWGGSSFGVPVTAPSGATNPGFSIGSGATLAITGSNASTLVNDLTGSPSEIYGALDAHGLGGPLFIANASGVVIGATGAITAPSSGVGLIGYAQDSATFAGAGTVKVDSSTIGDGAVTVAPGASVTGGDLLIAGNGAVNVGGPTTTAGALPATYIVAGYGFSAGQSSVDPAIGAALSGSSAAVALSGGSAISGATASPFSTFAPTMLAAAGAVTNSGVLDLSGTKGVGGTSPAVTTIDGSTLATTVGPTIGGTFTNTGVVWVGNTAANNFVAGTINNSGVLNDLGGEDGAFLTATGVPGASSGADIVNTGTVNVMATPDNVFITAGGPSTGTAPLNVLGNFENSGTIDFPGGSSGANLLQVFAANVYLGGAVLVDTKALGRENALAGFTFSSGYYYDNSATFPTSGVVDVASSVTSETGQIMGQAIRVLSGGLTAVGTSSGVEGLVSFVGSGTAPDPFFNNAELNYNFSLFPGTVYAGIQGASISIVGDLSSAKSPGPNINLNGLVTTQNGGGDIAVTGNTINGNDGGTGTEGGFALPDGGTLLLGFSGNVNNPHGAKAAGSSAFQYSFVPVSVGDGSSGQTGTATILLAGPNPAGGTTPSGSVSQFVNLLVEGNADLLGTFGPDGKLQQEPSVPTTPVSPYANNHLVVQASGNVSLARTISDRAALLGEFLGLAIPGPTGGPIISTAPDDNFNVTAFYWPGLLYLSNVASAANPTAVGAGTITLGDASGLVSVSNLLPANLTTPDLIGQTGHSGVFFITNKLVMVNGAGQATTVTTSNDSWVNFIDATTAAAFESSLGGQFSHGVVQGNVLNVEQLPASDFQPKS